ncbi:MAG TPA: methionine biosynthesis protein MetW, partial [Nitrosomonas sp.]|nr:methionine biosynthesis protein MetW [Nitrosomonas sp.]
MIMTEITDTISPQLRPDFATIAAWIKPATKVLDLGCGDGALLRYLTDTRQIKGYGV